MQAMLEVRKKLDRGFAEVIIPRQLISLLQNLPFFYSIYTLLQHETVAVSRKSHLISTGEFEGSMADIEAENSSWARTAKDLVAGAAGGIAQVLLGK